MAQEPTPPETSTTNSGAPVEDNQNSITAGARGPVLLQDYWLLEKLATFNRERIPERILGSLFSWLRALKTVPLVVAFNLAATNHVLVAIGSWTFLGERISLQRWLGILLVALGAVFVARPLARMNKEL
jgi:hypothetical protein